MPLIIYKTEYISCRTSDSVYKYNFNCIYLGKVNIIREASNETRDAATNRACRGKMRRKKSR